MMKSEWYKWIAGHSTELSQLNITPRQAQILLEAYVPVVPFKGKRRVLIPEPKCIDLDVQGATIAPLFAEGYLQLVNDTCILTDAGRCALVDVQNQTSKKGVGK